MEKLVLVLLCLILTVSCAEDLEKKKDGKPKAFEVAQPLTEELLTYEVQGLEKPNEYLIKFNWPRSSDAIEIKRAGAVKRVAPSFESGFEEIVQGGRTYNYDFKAASYGSIRREWSTQVTVPLDVVLSGKIDYSGAKIITANRLYIAKNAEIYSYKNPLTIDVNEIIAEGGNLQNYPVGFAECPAPFVRHASNGGNITIKAKSASGSLSVTTVGASPIYLRCGSGGNGGHLKVQIDDGLRLQLDTKLLEAPQSIGKGYYPGAPGSACISLKKDDGNECN